MPIPREFMGRTFSLTEPADLYEKINFEALELHNNPPTDIKQLAYALMNTLTSAWQMKDWIYRALYKSESLDRLDSYSGRKIKSAEDYGAYLTERSPLMNMCFQIATASKHLGVRQSKDGIVITYVGLDIDPGTFMYGRDGKSILMVATPELNISGPDLALTLVSMWKEALVDLDLMEDDESPQEVALNPAPPPPDEDEGILRTPGF